MALLFVTLRTGNAKYSVVHALTTVKRLLRKLAHPTYCRLWLTRLRLLSRKGNLLFRFFISSIARVGWVFLFCLSWRTIFFLGSGYFFTIHDSEICSFPLPAFDASLRLYRIPTMDGSSLSCINPADWRCVDSENFFDKADTAPSRSCKERLVARLEHR